VDTEVEVDGAERREVDESSAFSSVELEGEEEDDEAGAEGEEDEEIEDAEEDDEERERD
jgi:hypothetical protein